MSRGRHGEPGLYYTIEEAIENLREATELYLEEFPLPKVMKPLMTTFEATVNA